MAYRYRAIGVAAGVCLVVAAITLVFLNRPPDDDLRRGAQMLLNVMLAERAVLGVNGYLGGPSFRCRTADANGSLTNRKVAYLMDARYDGLDHHQHEGRPRYVRRRQHPPQTARNGGASRGHVPLGESCVRRLRDQGRAHACLGRALAA